MKFDSERKCSLIFNRGSNMLNESWAINAYCRPQFVSNVAESPALKHFPSIAACPVTCHAGARKRPAISFNRVDFPQPLVPIMDTRLLFGTAKLIVSIILFL